MNKIFFPLVLLSFGSLSGSSQNVTLDEMLNLRTRSITYVEEYLTGKNWSLISSEPPKNSSLGFLTFAYKKSDFNDKAESFINYYYSTVTNRKRISVQIITKEKYSAFLSQLKTKGFNFVGSEAKENEIEKIYRNNNTTIIISIIVRKETYSTETSYKTLRGNQ